MPIYSGKIGDMIEFDVLNAGMTTGVKFGASAVSKNFKIQPDLSTVLARVPTDAYWGQVSFHKTPLTNVYNVLGSGYANSGALNDLQTKLTSLNLYSSNCTSGNITYANTYEATALCDLKATGQAKAEASGILYDAYGSGWCGDNTNGFTSSGYSANTTRLNDFSMFQNQSGDWLALGFVQNTGNFIYKTAKLDVTCLEAQIETTPYNFVPIPLITDFNPKEASQGNNLKIVGNAFSGVTDVKINDVQVPHQVVSNYEITGSIPSGSFAHKMQVVGPSGVKAYSLNEFVSFSPLAGVTLDKSLKITSGQSITIDQGSTENIYILGSNISGLTLAQLTDENSTHTSVLNDSTFSYDSDAISFSPQSLQVGLYDFAVANSLYSASADNILKVIGKPNFSYSYNKISTINLINEPENYSDRQSVQNNFQDKTYSFTTAQDAEKFCLRFDNNSNSGYASYELQRPLATPVEVDYVRYFIKGTGEALNASSAKAKAKWGSGIWTQDENNNHYDASSYKLQDCLCQIVDSGDALYGWSADALQAHLFATGYAKTGDDTAIKLQNLNNINQQLNSYPDYVLSSVAHNSTVQALPYNFGSGVSYPFPTYIFTDCSHSFWDKLYASGKSTLYPHGYTTGIASSGCSVNNSNNFTYSISLSGVGRNETVARNAIETEKNLNYVYCQTGNYNVSTLTFSDTITRSGTTFGYC